GPAGDLRADQAHRVPDGPDSRSGRQGRGATRRGTSRRGVAQAARRNGMTAFLINNMAPLMFASLIVVMLFGYPVAFALAASGIFFGLLGIELGMLQSSLFQALPQRL